MEKAIVERVFMNNLLQYPYNSSRCVVLGRKCAVATSQSLATLAGMEMFWAGGNAVDAAIATAIALTVVEPTSNGIGGDAFALVWDDGKLHGLNASGRSPQALTSDRFKDLERIPLLGWLSVTVPGAVSGWRSLWEKWGKLPFEQLFSPAIRYASEGYPVSPITAQAWQQAAATFLPLTAPKYQSFKQVFFPQNRAPKVGEIWGSKFHAATLKEIAATGGESFYQGKLAQAIAKYAEDTGGLVTTEDLANHQADWVEPISTQYGNLKVWEIPPNTQGIAALMGLNILEGFDLQQYPRDSGASFHRQIEAIKLAFADLHQYVADPRSMSVSSEQLLAKNYAAQRRELIGERAISLATPGLPTGGTVYLAAADENLMVSLIQSNYQGFGSGLLVPETGIALHNRGLGFTLEPGHPNEVAPHKRPFHTIIPGFLTEGDRALGPFGVMGAPMQPQGHLQVVVNMVNYGMNPQSALDAPRWRYLEKDLVLLETHVPQDIVLDLVDRGHNIRLAHPRMFGKGQIILRQDNVLIAASEPRADGLALAF
ncbi:Gamma-glutamyltransferase [Hyella patelloides LEGE 07179]|uniref:Gamma-glutamyltransferase n=2 Tax=Hyella TaxID=945733 RepID=A0A563VXH9_9CYAN|nr:gamma-glutamyltransferase family protein [Hyella patelloides]VEP16158.1 Gamma-glutamyltransferase [Hyella patelloides LEGE 07179]